MLTLAILLAALAGLAFLALHHSWPPKPSLPGRLEHGTLEFGGHSRTWIAYLPVKTQARPALVIVLHGSMGTSEQVRQMYGYDFDLLAETHGFIAVYPQGYQGLWNDCRLTGAYAAKAENIDDVGFLHALVERMVVDHDADHSRVYVTGVSNGGSMVLRLALQTPDFARAYAAVVASVPAPGNMAITPKGDPVSMLFMNGTADPLNPWNGGEVAIFGMWFKRGRVLSANASIEYFLKLDGLGGAPSTARIPDTDAGDGSTAERLSWSAPGKHEVSLIRIENGGHAVPHPAAYGMRLLGRSNRDFHAAVEIWNFFQRRT